MSTTRRAISSRGAHGRVALLTLGLVVGLSACAVEDNPATPSATTDSDDAGPPGDAGAELEGTWQLRADYLRDGAGATEQPEDLPTLTFEDGALGVNTGCNTGGGDYEVDGNQLTLGPVALTMRACEGVTGDLERLVSGLLGATELTFAVDDGTLTLTAEDGTTLAFSATDGAPGDADTTTSTGPTATGPAGDSGAQTTGTQTQKAKKSDAQTQKAKKSGTQTQKAKKSGTEAPTSTS